LKSKITGRRSVITRVSSQKEKLMPSLNTKGPYALASDKIDEVVTQTFPGNDALGYIDDDNPVIGY